MRSVKLRTSFIIAAILVPNLARISLAADAKPIVFPPLQIFKDFCTDGSWSLSDLMQLAQQRHFALVTSEDLPLPDGIKAHMINWRADTEVGPIVLNIIAGENKSHDYRLTCTVTTPANYADFMQSWVKQSLGSPTSTLNKPNNATEIHWAQKFDGGTVEVTLNTLLPNDEKHASLSLTKQMAMTK